MHLQPRKLKDETTKYYLRYWHNNRNRCVPKEVILSDPEFRGEYPFLTEKEARDFLRKAKSLDDYKRHSEGLLSLKNKKKFHDFDELKEKFFTDLKTTAERSYQSSELYFNRYVMTFFLEIKQEYNIRKWHLLFRDYKIWLEFKALTEGIQGDRRNLSYSTKNHCIRTLNGFLKSMASIGELPFDSQYKCSPFPQYKVDKNARTYKDIIKPEEFKRIQNNLNKAKGFFTVLFFSGLRFNEAYSLSIQDVYFEEDVEVGIPEWIRNEYEKHEMKIYGYILITSQCKHKTRQRTDTGQVTRVPLKSRKEINDRDGRIIPITDPEAMNFLVAGYNRAWDEHSARVYQSSRKEDYFIFDESVGTLRKEFKRVCNHKYHDCRHSFCSELIHKMQNPTLVRIVSGHRDPKILDKYNHNYERYIIEGSVRKKKGKRKLIAVLKKVEKLDNAA